MEGTSHLVATVKCILIKAHIVKISVQRRHANYISKMFFFLKPRPFFSSGQPVPPFLFFSPSSTFASTDFEVNEARISRPLSSLRMKGSLFLFLRLSLSLPFVRTTHVSSLAGVSHVCILCESTSTRCAYSQTFHVTFSALCASHTWCYDVSLCRFIQSFIPASDFNSPSITSSTFLPPFSFFSFFFSLEKGGVVSH